MDIVFASDVLLPRLLAASVQSSLFVGVVWVLCRLMPGLPASSRAALWWLVAFQLVVGVAWSSPFALPLLPPVAAATAPAAADFATAPAGFGATVASDIVLQSPDPGLLPAWDISWSGVLAGLWLLGLALMLARTLRSFIDARRMLRAARPCSDVLLVSAVQLAARRHGLRSAPELRLSSAIGTPQLVGPWSPVLLLPADHRQSMRPDELDMALTHELVHLQRRDLWWGLVPTLARHLFFFHPLAHLAAREYELAREAACDAAVVEDHGHLAGDYAGLLVRLGVSPRPTAGLASASTNFHCLKRRLIMLQTRPATPRALALFVTLVVGVLGVVPYRIVAAPLPQSTAPEPARASRSGAPAEAPPAPPAPPAAPRSIAPAPPAPPAQPRPPEPPPAPAPPPPPAGERSASRTHVYSSGGDSAYVLMRGDSSVVMGSGRDLAEARSLRRGQDDVLWFRKGGARYVVRDPATLARFQKLFDEVDRTGQAQGALGRRQGELGAEQGRLGSEQGLIGAERAQLAAEQAHRASARAGGGSLASAPGPAPRERAAALEARQRELARHMARLGERQAQLGREQAALARKQAAASEQAEREARKLTDEAIAKGLAKPARG